MVFPAKSAFPFSHFVGLGFQDSFSTRSEFEKTENGNPKHQQISTIRKKIIIETHPQPRAAKRFHLGGVKPLKLTTRTKLSTVFPKAQRSQSEAKKEQKSGLRASKTDKNREPKLLK